MIWFFIYWGVCSVLFVVYNIKELYEVGHATLGDLWFLVWAAMVGFISFPILICIEIDGKLRIMKINTDTVIWTKKVIDK